MSDRTDPRRIEEELAQERKALSATLGALGERLRTPAMAEEALHLLTTQGSSLVGSVGRVARANPLGFAMIGAGLAWILFGGKKSRPAAAARPADSDDSLADAIADLRVLATERLEAVETAARRQSGGTAGRRHDFAAERHALIASLVHDLTALIADGPEDRSATLTDAFERAQATASAVAESGKEKLKSGKETAEQAISDHPLLATSIALTLGALLGQAGRDRRRADDGASADLSTDDSLADTARQLESEAQRLMDAASSLRSAQSARG